MTADLLIHNISSLYTMDPLQSNSDNPLGCFQNASIAFANRRVVYVGPKEHAPKAIEVLDADGCICMPRAW